MAKADKISISWKEFEELLRKNGSLGPVNEIEAITLVKPKTIVLTLRAVVEEKKPKKERKSGK